MLFFFFLIFVNNSFSKDSTSIFLLDSLYGFASEILETNPDQSLDIGKRIIQLSIETNNNSLLPWGYEIIARSFSYKNRIDSAFFFAYRGLNIAEKINSYRDSALFHYLLGVFNKDTGAYTEALSHLNKSLNISENYSLEEITAKVLNSMSEIYIVQNEIDKALEVLLKSAEYKKKYNDLKGLSRTYNNIGNIYNFKSDFVRANFYYMKSNQLKTELKDSIGIAKTYNNLAYSYFMLRQYKNAETFAKKGLTISHKINDSNSRLNLLKNLSAIYQGKNDRYNALETYIKYTNLKDSIYNLEKEKQIAQIREEYETEKKDRQIESQSMQLEQTKTEMLFLLTAFGFTVVVVVMVFYAYNQKKKSNKALARQKDKISEINKSLHDSNIIKDKLFTIIAHDLKAPINSIYNSCQTIIDYADELNFEKAYEVLPAIKKSVHDVNLLIENLFNWAISKKNRVPFMPIIFDLCELIASCVTQQLEFASKKNIKIYSAVCENLYIKADINMVNSVLRNLLNNAIKFTPKEGQIIISSKKYNDFVLIYIMDTGIGITKEEFNQLFCADNFSTPGTQNERGTGLGLQICRDFLITNGGALYINSQPGIGTDVCFKLKLETTGM